MFDNGRMYFIMCVIQSYFTIYINYYILNKSSSKKLRKVEEKRQDEKLADVYTLAVFAIVFLKLFSCFVVDKCDLVHDADSTFHLRYLLTASGNFS